MGLELQAIGLASAAKATAVTIDTINRARKPRKTYSRIFAAASGATALKIVPHGDSLAGKKLVQVQANLDRLMGGQSTSLVNTAGNGAAAGNGSAGNDLAISTSSGLTPITLDYNYWITGSYSQFAAGGSATWQLSGGTPIFTRVRVYYVKEPNAGTVNLVVGGSTVATASAANASVALGVLEYTQAVASGIVSTTFSGATVRVLFVHVEDQTQKGIDLYSQFIVGGLLLNDPMANVQGVALWKAALTQIAPDLITFEMDDDFGDSGVNDASWTTFANGLDSVAPLTDKVIIGSTPRASNDNLKLRSRDYLKAQVYTRGASYMFFDSYSIMGSYADMDAIFGTDDGVHPLPAAEAFAADQLWQFLGLSAFNTSYVPRAVNDRGTPSIMARGTTWGDGSTRGSMTVDTDSSFGLDWKIKVSRTLEVQKLDGTASGWYFSLNTGVTNNQMPSGTRVGATGNPGVFAGSGTPEGSKTAPVGSTYMRSDGGAATSFYVKESGSGNTGWVAK